MLQWPVVEELIALATTFLHVHMYCKAETSADYHTCTTHSWFRYYPRCQTTISCWSSRFAAAICMWAKLTKLICTMMSSQPKELAVHDSSMHLIKVSTNAKIQGHDEPFQTSKIGLLHGLRIPWNPIWLQSFKFWLWLHVTHFFRFLALTWESLILKTQLQPEEPESERKITHEEAWRKLSYWKDRTMDFWFQDHNLCGASPLKQQGLQRHPIS